ncbi:beta-L-arabinofuranosidase domain-containing protein [Enterococcus sp. DIV0876]|uniref:beta-L-arabinofuranosidase domain-containing protein n=1 Tax=Enterococcus sp. DIV0876 TaxID=2774633 RepID=UPI003D2FCF8B
MEMEATVLTTEKIEEILLSDLADIYLGNLGTVDTDLQLPFEGKRGSRFSWQTGEILFISNEGKVTRPTFGVGNREVNLEVTASMAGITKQRIFTATVLEEEQKTTIVKVYPVHVQKKDLKKSLPSVCVAKLDNGEYTTVEVAWNQQYVSKDMSSMQGQVAGGKYLVELIVIEDFETEPVHLLESYATKLLPNSPFKDAADRMLSHLEQVDIDQLLYSFREVADLSTRGAKPMTGWDAPECNLKGHTTGHYLSSLSLAAYATKNPIYYEKVEALVNGLRECQLALADKGMHEGFISAYSEKQFDLLEKFTTYPTIWAPYYTLDKLFQGLLDSYQYADNETGLSAAVALGDWTTKRLAKLLPEQLNKMWSIYIAGEFGGMISALMRLYHLTHEEKYLNTALLFENDKLFVPMAENFDTLDGVHANQHIPQILGALDIYEETGEKKYYEIAENFWQIVTNHHAYSIGGVGETEMFKGHGAIRNYITSKSAESCASHNLLKLSRKLFDIHPDKAYMDYYENVLHNHLLSAASHSCDGGTTYFMPLEPAAHKHFDTDENTCCHGTGLETLLRFQKDIYAFADDTVYVNLFYPSEVKAKDIAIRQLHADNHRIELVVDLPASKTLKIRRPQWADLLSLTVSGQVKECSDMDYLVFTGEMVNTKIILDLKPVVRLIAANDDPTVCSIAYGRDILAEISESNEYQQLSFEKIKKGIVEKNNYYQLDGRQFVPLNQINEQSYHVYFQIV